MKDHLPQRFWEKVDKNGPVPKARPDLGPCWIWTAAKNEGGYGKWWINSRAERVHRTTFEAFKGPIPKGMEPDHLCRVRECCNPDHLEAVTKKVNFQRGSRAGKLGEMHAAKTHCPKGHPYDEKNTIVSTQRGGIGIRRKCRACEASWQKSRSANTLLLRG